MPNYVACAPRMYKGTLDSLVRRMIPFADLIQITHLKLQQVVSKVVPDGVFIDADGLSEVDLGTVMLMIRLMRCVYISNR